MSAPLVLVTGFGPFPGVERNPSGLAAGALAAEPPDGVEVAARELPVELFGAAEALEVGIAGCPRTPDFVLALGVHRGDWFRPEGLARRVLTSTKPDNAGRFASELAPLGERDLDAPVDVEAVAAILRESGALRAEASRDAGGYVCERTAYAVHAACARLSIAGLFLHVPPIDAVPLADQLAVLRRAIPRIVEVGGPR